MDASVCDNRSAANVGSTRGVIVNQEADFAEQFIASIIDAAAIPSTSGQDTCAARMSVSSDSRQ